MNQPLIIVAYIPDLMFGVRVQDVIRQLGYQAQMVESQAELAAALDGAVLCIIDARGSLDQFTQLVQTAKLQAPTVPVLAFGSHVDVARQKAALAAGCDRVVANSAFSRDLPQIIQKMLG